MPIGAFKLNTISKGVGPTESYWYNILSGNGVTDRSSRSVIDSSGNVYVVGQYTSNEQGLIYKFNSSGEIQWQKQMASGYVLRNIAIDSTNGVYVCGANESSSPSKPWVAKINTTDGSLTWQKTHNSDLSYSNSFNGIEVDSSNNINLCGRNNDSSGYYLSTMVRYDTSGNRVVSYSHAVSSSYPEFFATCQQASTSTSFRAVGVYFSSPNYYALVCNRSTSQANTTYYFSRMSTGLSTSSNNRFNDCVYDPVGAGFYIVGGTYETSAARVVIVKLASGTTISVAWARYLAVPTSATAVALDSTGNVYITYNNSSIGYISKFNSSGTIQWTRSITASTGYITLNDVTWKNNSLYLSGETTVNGQLDPTTWKVPDDGTKTGSYGNFTYAAITNPTVTNYTPTFTSITQTAASRANTVSSTTVTPSTTTMTSTTTLL